MFDVEEWEKNIIQMLTLLALIKNCPGTRDSDVKV